MKLSVQGAGRSISIGRSSALGIFNNYKGYSDKFLTNTIESCSECLKNKFCNL